MERMTEGVLVGVIRAERGCIRIYSVMWSLPTLCTLPYLTFFPLESSSRIFDMTMEFTIYRGYERLQMGIIYRLLLYGDVGMTIKLMDCSWFFIEVPDCLLAFGLLRFHGLAALRLQFPGRIF
jgi:hypothetical protein